MKLIKKVNTSLSAEDILAKVDEYSLFKYYISSFQELGTAFCSELRKDNNPSACVYMDKNGRIKYKDYADSRGNGDVWDYLRAAFFMNYDQVLQKVARDFGITGTGTKYERVMSEIHKGEIKQKQYSFIQVGTKKATKDFTQYWNDYHLDLKDLNTLDVQVYQVKDLWLNRKKIPLPKDEIVIAYLFNEKYWKIYRPFADKKHKWLSNVPVALMYNLSSIDGCESAIILKSVKDMLVSLKFLSKCSTGVQSENEMSITKENIQYLKENSVNQYVIFDTDERGVSSCKYYNQYGLGYWNVPKKYPEKDISDFTRSHGPDLLLQEVSKKIKL